MSDQPPDPTDEPRTFWYRCAWGHIEERELASEDAPPLRCGANIAGVPGAPIASLCTAELRFYGPTVVEWRSMREARDAAAEHAADAERLLAAADQALSECSGQLDEVRAQLDSAEREVEHLRNPAPKAPTLGPIYPRLADALAALRAAVAPGDIRLSYAQLVEATVARITELERDQQETRQLGDLSAGLSWQRRLRDEALAVIAAELDWPEAEPVTANGLVQRIRLRKSQSHQETAERERDKATAQEIFNAAGWERALKERDEARSTLEAANRTNGEALAQRDAAVRERDKARAERLDYANRLAALRTFLNAEAIQAVKRGRHGLAARLRAAKAASWSEVKIEPHYKVISETIDGAAVSGTFLSEAIAAVLAEKAREAEGGAKLAEFGAAGGRLGSLFRDTIADYASPDAWRVAVAELRELYALDSDAPTLIRKAVYEIHEARKGLSRAAADYETLRQRMLRAERKVGELRGRSQGFTVVRDVNQQTERERDKAREELRAALTMRGEARSVAAWAVSSLTNVHHDYPEARAVYERAIDAATDGDWDAPPAAAAEILGEGTMTFPPDCAVRVKAGMLVAVDDGKGLPLVRAKVESVEIHADGLGPYDALLILDRSHLRVNDLH